jgi:hypothetical protein
MCQFISFFHRPDNGDIEVYDLTSHNNTQSHLQLNEQLWREGHYLPNNEAVCRVSDTDKVSEAECTERLLAKYPTFWDFWNFVCTKEVTGDVDLRGCDLSKVKQLNLPKEIGGSLDLSGCDLSKITQWPEKIGCSLYLNGCDLSKVTQLPKEIGGSLDLYGCDLSKVKQWPEEIGGSLATIANVRISK